MLVFFWKNTILIVENYKKKKINLNISYNWIFSYGRPLLRLRPWKCFEETCITQKKYLRLFLLPSEPVGSFNVIHVNNKIILQGYPRVHLQILFG